ncbi:hypothetical protein EI94DRAFT_1804297 [Lactarius quietus]|nr:hypothetical protein EI94DRAFT_1804297 [Lactarius quietus]
MQEPFLALTSLYLWSEESDIPIFPSEFLGRSAPRLQELIFEGIPFPALPVLLPSTSDLVTLELYNIPQNGYISPEAMVAGLATLTSLRDICIAFRSPNPCPNRIRLPPTTWTVLPTLTSFKFDGLCKYLEDFMSRIDTPQLGKIRLTYFNQLFDFKVPQLSRFIDHSEAFPWPMDCSVHFYHNNIFFTACHTSDKPDFVNFSSHCMEVLRSDPTPSCKQHKCLHEHWKNCQDYPEAHTWEARDQKDIEEEEAVRAFVAAEDNSYLAYDEACKVRQFGTLEEAMELGGRQLCPEDDQQ